MALPASIPQRVRHLAMSLLTPRYLVPFHPRELPHFFADVLVIGGGLAGLRAANAVDPKLSVLVVTKDAIFQSNSSYAQGGIAGVLDPDDRFEWHVSDTLLAGGTLCDEKVVEMVIREAPGRIQELIDWGTHFDELAGRITLGREGGHSHNRIVHALGDMTGREVMRAVIEHTRGLPHVRIWESTFTIDLLTHAGACRGALVATRHGEKMLVWARQTILATGGCGQIYRESTNPSVATGDGHAMAYRAGAQVRDMEFVQFHPTVLYIAGGSRSLITEAVRGEGGHLVDKDGLRFMPHYDERAELAPRDVVSQAIVTQMEKTQHPCVYLDVTHLDPAFVLHRFPGIAAACKQFGIDITRDKIPVRPGAHYMIGGLTVNLDGQTTVPGLWAAGEVASSGLHGANRLASNSLLEGLVYGAHAGEGASRAAFDMPDGFQVHPLENAVVAPSAEPLDLADIRNSLKSLMWRQCGVRRSGEGLSEALETVDGWRRYVLVRQFDDLEGWELQNMLTLARVMIAAALAREESRGVHLRTDFPERDDARWNKHLWFQRSEAPVSETAGAIAGPAP
jgi:L-aspartate oxidase